MIQKILIVEDNDLNRKLFRDLLQAHGYETLEATTGVQAIEVATREQPDLVILDIQLPEISGLEVLKWMKSDLTLQHIPVIAVTAFAMKSDECRILNSGVQDYLPKPISIDRFMNAVKSTPSNTQEPSALAS